MRSRHRGRTAVAARRALCHHARRRHRASARRGGGARSARSRIRSTAPSSTRRAAASCGGYGILQPRVSVSLDEREPVAVRRDLLRASRRRSVHDGRVRRVPGSVRRGHVHGKGIYDVAAFERATDGRFPENTLLSHDLIEGNVRARGARHRRRGVRRLSDALPHVDATEHRWIRGDWQLLRWSRRPRLERARDRPRSRAGRCSTTCAAASSRSRLPGWLVAGWTVLAGHRDRVVAVAARRDRGVDRPAVVRRAPPAARQAWRPYYAALPREHARLQQTSSSALVLLPDQALLAADAIVRTLVRRATRGAICSSGKRRRRRSAATASAVLSAHVARRLGAGPRVAPGAARRRCVGMLSSCRIALRWLPPPPGRAPAQRRARTRPSLARRRQRAACCATAAALALLRPLRQRDTTGSLPTTIRRRRPVVADRTSPTNIGLQLLSTVSACDLGFLQTGECRAAGTGVRYDDRHAPARVDTSTIGTRWRTCACSSRRTSRRSIPAISPVTSWRYGRPPAARSRMSARDAPDASPDHAANSSALAHRARGMAPSDGLHDAVR